MRIDNVVEILVGAGAVTRDPVRRRGRRRQCRGTDSHTLISFPARLLSEKSELPDPQPVIVLTKLASGDLRRYELQVDAARIAPRRGAPIATVERSADTTAGRSQSSQRRPRRRRQCLLQRHFPVPARRVARDTPPRSRSAAGGQSKLNVVAQRDRTLNRSLHRRAQLPLSRAGEMPGRVAAVEQRISTAFVFPGMQRCRHSTASTRRQESSPPPIR